MGRQERYGEGLHGWGEKDPAEEGQEGPEMEGREEGKEEGRKGVGRGRREEGEEQKRAKSLSLGFAS